MLTFSSRLGAASYSLNANATVARQIILDRYKPRYGNSWDEYRTGVENRWSAVSFGYDVIGQFQSMEEIENHPVNIDGQNNRTLLPGDLIYRDVNNDGIINGMDERPIGYGINQNPILAYGFGGTLDIANLSLTLSFAGGTMYSYNRQLEMKNPFQGDHNSPEFMLTDRWHRADPYDDNSEWIPGHYPAIRRGLTNHVSYTRNSDFWRTNVNYLRLKRAELAYTLPDALLSHVRLNAMRIYISGANLFTLNNLAHIKLDPEVIMDSGLRYPTQRVINLGVSASLGGRSNSALQANQ
jgi:hypothetical protein